MQAEKHSLLVIGHALTVDVIGLVRILVGGRNAKTPERRSQSRSCNQKRRTLLSAENSILIPLTTPTFAITWNLDRRGRKQMRNNSTNH